MSDKINNGEKENTNDDYMTRKMSINDQKDPNDYAYPTIYQKSPLFMKGMQG